MHDLHAKTRTQKKVRSVFNSKCRHRHHVACFLLGQLCLSKEVFENQNYMLDSKLCNILCFLSVFFSPHESLIH